MWSLMVRPLVFEVFVALAVLVAVLWLAIFYTSRPVKLKEHTVSDHRIIKPPENINSGYCYKCLVL